MIAAAFFGFLALGAVVGLLRAAPRSEPGRWLLPAVRVTALAAAALAYLAWLLTL